MVPGIAVGGRMAMVVFELDDGVILGENNSSAFGPGTDGTRPSLASSQRQTTFCKRVIIINQ